MEILILVCKIILGLFSPGLIYFFYLIYRKWSTDSITKDIIATCPNLESIEVTRYGHKATFKPQDRSKAGSYRKLYIQQRKRKKEG